MMTAQDIFNKVVAHLRAQGRQSTKDPVARGACTYHAQDGTKCAVGCLIHESFYSISMEGNNIGYLVGRFESLNYLQPHLDLLGDLQELHDGVPVSVWESGFAGIAAKHSLEYSAP